MKRKILLFSFAILLVAALVLVLSGPRIHATEGFQEGAAAAAAATDLERKVVELQGTAAAIQSAKEKQEAALSRVLDVETMGMLDFLFAEVRFYLDPSPEKEMVMNVLKKMEAGTATAAESSLLQMMIGTAYQQSQVLFYIYVTLPSTVVSSKLVVDAGEVAGGATAALADPKVIAETRQTVEAVLGKLPSPSVLQKAAEGEFLAAAGAVETAGTAGGAGGVSLTAETVANLTNSFLRYKRLSENLLFQYEQAVRRARVATEAATAAVGVDPLKGTSGSGSGASDSSNYSPEGINLDDPALKLAMTNLDLAQKQRIAVLDKVVATMKAADSKTAAAELKNPANVGLAEVRKTMGAAVRTFDDMIAAASSASGVGAAGAEGFAASSTGLVRRSVGAEGFVSKGNPYSSPSPNLQQAFQFRLGKRELVDAVMQYAK